MQIARQKLTQSWENSLFLTPVLLPKNPFIDMANDKHQAPTNGLKLYARAVVKSGA